MDPCDLDEGTKEDQIPSQALHYDPPQAPKILSKRDRVSSVTKFLSEPLPDYDVNSDFNVVRQEGDVVTHSGRISRKPKRFGY